MINLLVIMIDCLRHDRFRGPDKTALTPNLDALYEGSVSFENLHAVGSNTTAVMGSWFTGRYPFANGLRCFRSLEAIERTQPSNQSAAPSPDAVSVAA
jgi:arylsulfatase A-like enzyme